MQPSSLTPSDLRTLSVAVQIWYRHYGIPLNANASCRVCAAAMYIFRHGIVSVDQIAQVLIDRFPPEQPSDSKFAPTIH